jgi:hypothetical protein
MILYSSAPRCLWLSFLLCLPLLLGACESSTDSEDHYDNGGLPRIQIHYATPVVPKEPVRFEVFDTISSGKPHQYRWLIPAQRDTIVTSKPWLEYEFEVEGNHDMTVTVINSQLVEVARGRVVVQVRKLDSDFRLRTEHLGGDRYRFFVEHPFSTPLNPTWYGAWSQGTGDTALIQFPIGPGRHPVVVRYLFGGEKSLDTFVTGGGLRNTLPAFDLLSDCRIDLKFYGDHTNKWNTHNPKTRLIEDVITTDLVDSGTSTRDANSFSRISTWATNRVGFGPVEGSSSFVVRFSPDRRAIDSIYHYSFEEGDRHYGYAYHERFVLKNLRFVGSNDSQVVYMYDGPDLLSRLEYIRLQEYGEPRTYSGYGSTLSAGLPKPFVQVVFTKTH